MKKLIGILFFFTSAVAVAEPKQLVCSYKDPSLVASTERPLFDGADRVITTYLPIGSQIASATWFCGEYPTSSSDHCGKKSKLLQLKGECLKTPDIPRYTFTFDTGDLTTGNGVNAEFSADRCGGTYESGVWVAKFSNSGTEKVGLSATPSVISFSKAGSKKLDFNVDRKTLTGGYGTNRFFQCEVRDVDMSQNAI